MMIIPRDMLQTSKGYVWLRLRLVKVDGMLFETSELMDMI
jgi:hypothetical protein